MKTPSSACNGCVPGKGIRLNKSWRFRKRRLRSWETSMPALREATPRPRRRSRSTNGCKTRGSSGASTSPRYIRSIQPLHPDVLGGVEPFSTLAAAKQTVPVATSVSAGRIRFIVDLLSGCFVVSRTWKKSPCRLDPAHLDIAEGNLPVIALEGDVTG